MAREDSVDVAVIGGGLTGVAAAAFAARSGRSVVLLDKAGAFGGRAVTTASGGFRFNLGPHALYRGGSAEAVLGELGVAYSGASPNVSGGLAVARGAAHALPGGLLSLLTTGLFGPAAKLETRRLFKALPQLDPEPLQRVSVRQWLATAVRSPAARDLMAALARLSTYTADHDRLSAGAALAQIQAVFGRGVWYLDGGWQTLVDGLVTAATQAGVCLRSSTRAAAVRAHGARWTVSLANGEAIDAGAVILASGLTDAAAVLDGTAGAALRGWADTAVPVRAACLDIGLSQLPRPRATFALGVDRPLYLSVHSAVARLAPAGAATIHVAKYLATEAKDARGDERELEGLLDLIQPGWRAHVVERRFLPSMLVMSALPTAAAGGTSGRPGAEVPGAPGVYVAGDWVGSGGLLADACLGSAKRAAELIMRAPAVAAA